jgi:tRNA threonylcarbamoyladenosine biosynthesis protein TsaE
MSSKLEINSAEAMIELGKKLAGNFQAGDLVVLDGPVGAGKTTMTKGIAIGLDINDAITSPTFVIARVHSNDSTKPDLVHVDAYRLSNISEVDSLDLESSMDNAVTVVEWGSGLIDGLTDQSWLITITRDVSTDNDHREVEITVPRDRRLNL